jgi:hypothetical protein
MTPPRNAQTKQSKHFNKRKAALRAQYRKAKRANKPMQSKNGKHIVKSLQSKKAKEAQRRLQSLNLFPTPFLRMEGDIPLYLENRKQALYSEPMESELTKNGNARYVGLDYDFEKKNNARTYRNRRQLSDWFLPAQLDEPEAADEMSEMDKLYEELWNLGRISMARFASAPL